MTPWSALLLVAVAAGCASCDVVPEAVPWTRPLLGERSPALIAHLAAACPRMLEEQTHESWASPLAVTRQLDPGQLDCAASDADFRVRFDWRGRVVLAELRDFADERAAEALFDRAIGLIVPPDLRDRVRASIHGTPDMRRVDAAHEGSVTGTGGRLKVFWPALRGEHHYVRWEAEVPAAEEAPRGSMKTRATPFGELTAERRAAWAGACAVPLARWTVDATDPAAEPTVFTRHLADPDRWHVLRRPVGAQIVACVEGRRRGGQPIGWRVEADRRDRIYRIVVLAADPEALRTRAARIAATHVPPELREEVVVAIAGDPPYRPPVDEETGRLAIQVSRAADAAWGAELMWWVQPSLLDGEP